MYETQTAVLHCPCREFPPMANPAPIMTAYQEAWRRAGWEDAPQPGVLQRLFMKSQAQPKRFLPDLIAVGEYYPLEGFQWLNGETPEERRTRY